MSYNYPINYPRRNNAPVQNYPVYPPGSFQQPPQQPKSNKKIWLFLIIFIAIIITILFIFLFIKPSNTLSDDELFRGASVNLKPNQEVKFKVDNEEHKIILDSLHADSVDIVIQSRTIIGSLGVRETKKFDLDNDGKYDLKIRLIRIENGKAHLFIQEINEEVCVENWDCNEWSLCENGAQIRVCTDLNNCGTDEDKPDEEQSCTATCSSGDGCQLNCSGGDLDCSCSQQNATLCVDTWNCNGTVINSSDQGICCFWECIPILNVLECGQDWDCLINASQICSLTSFSSVGSTSIFKVIINSSTLIELKGIETNKCVYYQRTESMNIEYSQELIQQMLNSGMTQQEIDLAEQQANESAQQTIGLELTCKFVPENLTAMLIRWKEGDVSSGFSCTLSSEGANCTYIGDFEGAECQSSCYPESNCEEIINS